MTQRQKTQLETILDEYPQFYEPYTLKEMLRDIYTYAKTKEETEQAYAYWVRLCKNSACTAYYDFIKMVDN